MPVTRSEILRDLSRWDNNDPDYEFERIWRDFILNTEDTELQNALLDDLAAIKNRTLHKGGGTITALEIMAALFCLHQSKTGSINRRPRSRTKR